MKRIVFFKIFATTAVTLTLLATPQTSAAQRGGFHGGGGAMGFHGGGGFRGGGFSGFRGGSGFGNFRGGFGGFRGGRGFYGRGFYGGFRGYRGFYPGFYSGFEFGFWPYWGAYPYGYGHGWWGPGPYAYYSPYDYPDEGYGQRDGCRGDDPCDRGGRGPDHRDCYDYRQKCSSPDNRPDNRPEGGNAPAKPSSEAAPDGARGGNYLTVSLSNSAGSGEAAIEHVPSADTNSLVMRPAVRNAIAVLRAMPPAARERQLKSSRYEAFSPEERELLARAAQSSAPETTN